MQGSFSRRDTLLHNNAGLWQGTFLRFDSKGRELERFASQLQVADCGGTIHADLTNCNTGTVRSMQFDEPPAEMQITPDGHWSLGPDRIGPWPWVCELCLVWGEQRRRIVVRHDTSALASFVVVLEGRSPESNETASEPWLLDAPMWIQNQQTWSIGPPASLALSVMGQRLQGNAEEVCLQWCPEPGVQLEISRRYNAFGLLLDLGA